MSENTKKFSDILKGAQTATSTDGLWTLLINTAGELLKTGVVRIENEKMLDGVDINNIKDFRITCVQNSCLNIPIKANGLALISIPVESKVYHIMLRAGEGGMIYFRSFDNTWNPWKKVSTTPA